MKITQVRLGRISTPLRVPFKTALRTVNSVEDVIVELHTDTGAVGYGEAPPTGVITGDTAGAIIGAIQDHIAPAILGHDIDEFEDLTEDGRGNGVFHLTKAVSLTARDVRNLQLAKAAVAGGIRVLLEQRGVTADDIASVELAGGFGNYLSPESAVRIGMLPRACLSKIKPLGNAALAGASMLALDGENWRKLAEIPEKCRYLELSGRDDFSRAFTDSLTF